MPGADDQTIDQHLDRVLDGLGERDVVGELAQHAVDPRADEAGLAQLVQLLAVLALAAAHDRRAGYGGASPAGMARI